MHQAFAVLSPIASQASQLVLFASQMLDVLCSASFPAGVFPWLIVVPPCSPTVLPPSFAGSSASCVVVQISQLLSTIEPLCVVLSFRQPIPSLHQAPGLF